jgi:hypothetical protein
LALTTARYASRRSTRTAPSVATGRTLGSRRRCSVEGRRRIIRGDVIDVDLLEKEGASLVERWEGALHFQVRNHMTKLPVEAAQHR